MSRRSPRVRARLTVTATFDGDTGVLVCRTRDVSVEGVYLATPSLINMDTKVRLTLMDQATGSAIELHGTVVRQVAAESETATDGLAVRFKDPPQSWLDLVARAHQSHDQDKTYDSEETVRMRILVVGDEERRRGALALYVTSGWDIQFATKLSGAEEALSEFRVDAVIAETDLPDVRWLPLLTFAKAEQPWARRLVRAHLRGGQAPKPGDKDALVHRVVDFDAGLEALVDALTAKWDHSGEGEGEGDADADRLAK